MSENNLKYDFLIIGGGPGGYVAAIRASREFSGTVLETFNDLE